MTTEWLRRHGLRKRERKKKVNLESCTVSQIIFTIIRVHLCRRNFLSLLDSSQLTLTFPLVRYPYQDIWSTETNTYEEDFCGMKRCPSDLLRDNHNKGTKTIYSLSLCKKLNSLSVWLLFILLKFGSLKDSITHINVT